MPEDKMPVDQPHILTPVSAGQTGSSGRVSMCLFCNSLLYVPRPNTQWPPVFRSVLTLTEWFSHVGISHAGSAGLEPLDVGSPIKEEWVYPFWRRQPAVNSQQSLHALQDNLHKCSLFGVHSQTHMAMHSFV